MNTPHSVLIVEDEPAIRELYAYKFELAGYNVSVAKDGLSGLAACEQNQPDILLLDMRMPEMNGDEMLRLAREQPWGATMRVIILTNISRDEAPRDLRFMNVDRYMVKAHHTPAQIVAAADELLR